MPAPGGWFAAMAGVACPKATTSRSYCAHGRGKSSSQRLRHGYTRFVTPTNVPAFNRIAGSFGVGGGPEGGYGFRNLDAATAAHAPFRNSRNSATTVVNWTLSSRGFRLALMSRLISSWTDLEALGGADSLVSGRRPRRPLFEIARTGLDGHEKPSRGPTADQGVRPTKSSSCYLLTFFLARIDVKLGGAGFSLRGTLVPPVRWRTEVRRRLKSAPQELFYAVTVLIALTA